MKYGVLTRNSQNPNVPFTGKIACRLVIANLQLRSEDKRGKPNSPDYSVWANEGQGAYQLGNGWVKKQKDGGEFISLTLDSPDMTMPLNVTAFEVPNTDQLDIVWTRPKLDRKAKEAPQPVDATETGEQVPF